MPGYHNSLLGYCLDGVGAVFFFSLALIFTLVLGSVLGTLIVEGDMREGWSFFHALFWAGGMVVGLFQLWGLLSYFIIALEAIALFRADSRRWLILLSVLLIQTCESVRMALDYADRDAWLQGLAILGIVLIPVAHILLHKWMDRVPDEAATPWTDCRSCGYNLVGTLNARGTSCPECGEPISQYQHVRSITELKNSAKQAALGKSTDTHTA